MIRALAENDIKLAGGKRLFATFAKSKAERAIGAHAAWIKRAVATVCGQDAALRLDVEYSTGSVWAGNSFVGSAKQPHPPGLPQSELAWDEEKGEKHWVHVGGLARELGVAATEIQRGLRETQR